MRRVVPRDKGRAVAGLLVAARRVWLLLWLLQWLGLGLGLGLGMGLGLGLGLVGAGETGRAGRYGQSLTAEA